MKHLCSFGIGLITIGLIATSCNKNDENQIIETNTTSLTISIQGPKATTIPGTMNTKAAAADATEPDLNKENAVKNYAVYIFNEEGSSLQSKKFVSSASPATIENIPIGQKKIVVLTNLGIETNYPSATSYSGLQSQVLELSDFATDIGTNGLPMSGDSTITLVSGNNTKTIDVTRMLARIELGSLTINAPGNGYTGVQIKHMYVMKAKSEVAMISTDKWYLPSATAAYWGGMTGTTTSTQKNYLAETFPTAFSATHVYDLSKKVYFYVFPNKGDVHPTQLTLASVVNGDTRYFPIQINDIIGTGNNAPNGTFIKRNTIYTLKVTLKNHNSGTTSPEDTPANLDVTVSVKDWEGPIDRDIDWE